MVDIIILNPIGSYKVYFGCKFFLRNDDDVEAFLCGISIIQPDWITEAREECKNDDEIWALIQKL